MNELYFFVSDEKFISLKGTESYDELQKKKNAKQALVIVDGNESLLQA